MGMGNSQEVRRIRGRNLLLCLFFTFLVTNVSAQSTGPDLPHQVYGEITDFSGTEVPGIDVSFRLNGSTYGSGTTDSSGLYDVDISGPSLGETVFLFVNSSNTSKSVSFSAGSSERLDHAGDYLDDSGQQDQNDTGGDDGSGGGTGGGGSGDAGGGGEGGFFPEPDEGQEAEAKEFSVDLDSSDSVEVDAGDLVEGQSVTVSVTGGSSLTGFSFVSSEEAKDVAVNLSSFGERPAATRSPEADPYGYYFLDIENLSSYEDASLGFEVSNTWLEARNSSRNDVMLKYFDGGAWSDLDASSTGETLSSYVFEADTAVSGYFASAVPETEEEVSGPDISVRDVEVETEGTTEVAVNLSAEIVNDGEAGNGTLYLYSDGEAVDSRTFKMEAGETRDVQFSLVLDEPGNRTVQLGSFSREIRVESGPDWGFLIFAGVGGAVLLIVAILFGYIYVSETRRARELEEKISNFEENTGRFGQGMQNVRRNMGAQSDRNNRRRTRDDRSQGGNGGQGADRNQRDDRRQ
jgi:PGF-pre-PGF domain-containing protein